MPLHATTLPCLAFFELSLPAAEVLWTVPSPLCFPHVMCLLLHAQIRFLDSMRLKSLEAVVRDRFSQGGMRIFRMLMERGQLEQKQVCEHRSVDV